MTLANTLIGTLVDGLVRSFGAGDPPSGTDSANNILTEAGDNLVTEAGDPLVTES